MQNTPIGISFVACLLAQEHENLGIRICIMECVQNLTGGALISVLVVALEAAFLYRVIPINASL